MPKPPLTIEEKEKILEMAGTGIDVKEICRLLRRNHSCVYRALKAMGYNSQDEKEKRRAERWRGRELAKLDEQQKKLDDRMTQLGVPPKRKQAAAPKKVEERFVRLKGEYSNRSPYGIATAFHHQAI